MKIICTEEEKTNMENFINSSTECPFNWTCVKKDCEECIQERIRWEIVDEES